MKNLKKLTILHSNDMHGDFMAQEKDEKLIGGVSMLSGYLNKVRKEEKNVLYTISGDMFRGNVIDSEYKGMSTIEMMNMLAPDVVTLGNHEADYGIAHLLFLEKCAKSARNMRNVPASAAYTDSLFVDVASIYTRGNRKNNAISVPKI